LKGRKIKKKEKNMFSQRDIKFFNLIKVLEDTGFSFSEIKEAKKEIVDLSGKIDLVTSGGHGLSRVVAAVKKE